MPEMSHPVTGGVIDVSDEAVPIHEASGWVLTPAPEAADAVAESTASHRKPEGENENGDS